MSDDLMNADVAAMMVIMAVMMEALDSQQPGIKQIMAETIQAAVQDLQDHDNPHGVKETLQKFHGFITRDNPIEMLFH
jgi:hypothetical protein